MSIRLLIEQLSNRLSKTESKIARYILDNIEEIKEITSAQLAERADVGQSSVIKFIKKIGFDGFTDFKIRLSEELASKRPLKPDFLHNNITLDDSLYEITKKISYSHIESIDATTNNLSFTTLERVVDTLDRARKIVIMGVGASSLVGKDFQHKLTKIGKIALHDLDAHVQVTQAISSGKGDVILTISHSGETSLFIETLKSIGKNGADLISITGSERNSIGDLSHINIPAVATEDFIRSSALSSRIAQLTILDALFIGILKKNHESGLEYIDRSRKIIKILNSKR